MTDQNLLFDKGEWWDDEWQGMPEFVQNDLSPAKQIIVSFKSYDDMRAFGVLIGQTLTPKTQSVWYPKAEIETYVDKRYVDAETPKPNDDDDNDLLFKLNQNITDE